MDAAVDELSLRDSDICLHTYEFDGVDANDMPVMRIAVWARRVRAMRIVTAGTEPKRRTKASPECTRRYALCTCLDETGESRSTIGCMLPNANWTNRSLRTHGAIRRYRKHFFLIRCVLTKWQTRGDRTMTEATYEGTNGRTNGGAQ
ncbi:hypothetical protein [Paraburkholderia sp. 2C]